MIDNLQEPLAPEVPVEEVPKAEEEKGIPEELKLVLKELLDIAAKEDLELRERKLQEYRYLSLLWEGFTNIYWNDTNGDFSVFTNADLGEDETLPKTINIYRPYGESIIASLSTLIPGIVFYPDDAEVPEDIDAADAYDKLSKLIVRRNKGKLLFIKALMILYNQGLVCGYNYLKSDPRFGSLRTYDFAMSEQEVLKTVCSNCGYELEGNEPGCPSCGMTPVVPAQMPVKETIPQITGFSDEAKSRPALDLFGPQFVKLSYHARKQEDVGYLLLEFEQHHAMLKSIFKEFSEDIKPETSDDSYKRWARMDSQYIGNNPRDLATVRCIWFRPWWYHNSNKPEIVEMLHQKYPEGLYAIYINDLLVEVNGENVDDHWTLSFNPLSNFIHSQPLGAPVVPIQEIRNDLVDIEIETAAHGIPETFVAPGVLDLKKYKENDAKVGMLTLAKPPAGKDLNQAFHTTTPARLASEVRELKKEIDTDAQFVLGAYPSVMGATNAAGSKTYGEYEASANRALQRLSLTYMIASQFWSDLVSKSCTEFAQYIRDTADEKFVEKSAGSFINTWIRQSDLIGKVGDIEPEFSDQLPLTWQQKWARIQELMTLNNPDVNAVLLHPRNIDLMRRAVGITELYVPGDDSRNKQLGEFYRLIGEAPITDMMGELGPSVDIDADIDNDQAHMAVLQSLLEGPIGRYVQQANPPGYVNAVLHYKRHELNFAAKTMKPSGRSEAGEKPENN